MSSFVIGATGGRGRGKGGPKRGRQPSKAEGGPAPRMSMHRRSDVSLS
jgi:hypothetical protein